MKKYDTEKATRIGYKDYGLAMGDMYYRWKIFPKDNTWLWYGKSTYKIHDRTRSHRMVR